MMNGSDLIAVERAEQTSREGYTPEHDAGHQGELVLAAAAYALDAAGRVMVGENGRSSSPVAPWPWAPHYWKPTDDVVRELVKAGSLIAAAIDAIQAEREA